MADDRTKFLLGEDQIPTAWVNIVADLPGDPPPPPAARTPTTRSAPSSTTCCCTRRSSASSRSAGDAPDVVIGCVGGGSNFGGIMFPFLREKLRGDRELRFVAAEPAACPTLTRGAYRYDYGDTAGLTPLMPMYTLGHDFVPPPVHAGGLRYHGDSPLVSALVKAGLVEARALRQNETFEAAVRFARTKGILPAPEPARLPEAPALARSGPPRAPPRARRGPHGRPRARCWASRGPATRASTRRGRPAA